MINNKRTKFFNLLVLGDRGVGKSGKFNTRNLHRNLKYFIKTKKKHWKLSSYIVYSLVTNI